MKTIILKVVLFFTLVLILTGCSHQVTMQPATQQAQPQLLDEVQTELKNEEQMIAELHELQNLKTDIYKISPGDRFNIYVYDETDLDTEGILVKPDGTISFKLVGEVRVANLSVEEATALLEEKLKQYLIHPKVSMIPYELTGANITIIGKVNNSGTYEITSNMRVTEAIAVAGGLSSGIFQNNTVELADLERSYIIRDKKILPVNFRKLIREGDMLHNIPLIDGDYIYIPSSVNREVYVLGEVGNPWHFLYKENMTLMQVITFARGMNSGASSQVVVVRGGLNHPRVFRVDVKKILKGESRDFPLEPNDIVYVTKTPLLKWNELLSLLMPSLEAVQSAWMADQMFRN